jgi:hypothetical protein
MFKIFSTNHRRPSAPTPMYPSMNNQDKLPGGPSPDYQSTETQHQATSASGETAGSNSRRSLGRATENTDRPSPEGIDVVPQHSVVTRQPDFAIAQSTGNTSSDRASQTAHQSDDIDRKQSLARGSQLENSSGATAAVAAADPKPIIRVKPASEHSGDLSRGPSDASRLRPEYSFATPKALASGEVQRSASLASRRTGHSLATNGSAFANGAATTASNAPDVDPTRSLQARAASAEGELSPRDKAVISKEESTSSSRRPKGRM